MISITFPAYNEGNNVSELHFRIKKVMEEFGVPYEIIAVDDGSTDDTLENLKRLKSIKVVVLSRNYGQTSAMDAGLKEAKGDVIVTLDADLQNDPADISRIIRKLDEGYDVVSGWRKNRHDDTNRKISSKLANWLTWRVTGLYLHDHACALKAYRASILNGVNLYGEMHVFLPAYLFMMGAKITELEVTHHPRTRDLSKHNFMKAVKAISDLLTIKFISSATRPLLFFSTLAICVWCLSFIFGLLAIIFKIIGYANLGQTPLLLLSVFMAISGLILFSMGFLAEILLRVYYESKMTKPYRIREIIET